VLHARHRHLPCRYEGDAGRLTHRCRIIETKGESYRLQDAKARNGRAKAGRKGSGHQLVEGDGGSVDEAPTPE